MRDPEASSWPETVVGYHGCPQEVADLLLAGQPWQPSANTYDWLGGGIYFWEYAPHRAGDRARERHGERAVSLRATLRLALEV